ncbi:MAG TPA: ATP-binding protein [Prolixibacteraceae bacterium]
MPKKFESGLKSKYPHLHKQELGLIRIFFYIDLLLLAGALVLLTLDLLNFFNSNYSPHILAFTGIFILIFFFLREGKQGAALNVLHLLPLPAYFLMISTQYAILAPETSYNFEIYLYTSGLAILLLLSERPRQLFTYLLVTTGVLIGHLLAYARKDLLLQLIWNESNSIHPVFLYLLVGGIGYITFVAFHLRLQDKEQRIHILRENQNRIFTQYFEGILRFTTERDELGERIGYKVTYINPAFEEYFEVRNSEVKGMPVHLLFQKLFRGEIDWQSLFDPSKRTKKEILVPHTEKWFQVTSIPVDKENLICFFENITSAKTTIAELGNSKHRYKLLLETIPDIFFVIDKDGTYIDYVPKSDTGIDKQAVEIIGSTIFEVGFSARMVKQVSKSIKTVLVSDSIETIEYALEVKGKGTCFFEMRMVKLNKDAVMAVSRDISKQKFAVQAIEEARKKAEEADMLKTAFLQNISHEVRTPLNAVVGFSNILLTDEVSRNERMNYLQIIARNCQILLHVFSDTIKLSKIQSGVEKVNYQLYNLNGLVNELYRQTIYEKGQLEKDHLKIYPVMGNDNPKFSILCDGSKIKDILESLIDNALKFTEEGEIEFGYYFMGDNLIEFFVRDTGIGIPEEQFEKIFDRFYQIDSRMKRAYGGSGIGLSLANDFVKMLGSAIKVESIVGVGSRFSFIISYKENHSHLRIV